MTPASLSFSRRRLLRTGAISVLAGVAVAWLGYRLNGGEGFARLHEAFILYLFGPYGPRVFLVAGGLAFAAMGALTLRRLVRNPAAVAIRLDGIAVEGVFGARLVRWRELDSIALSGKRLHGKVLLTLTIRSRRAPDEGRLHHFLTGATHIPAAQIDATPRDIAAWVAAARAAQAKALLLPPLPLFPPLGVGTAGRTHKASRQSR